MNKFKKIWLNSSKCSQARWSKMAENLEKKAPNVRFKGFTYDWEQQKLENLVTVNSGRDYKHLSEGNIPVYGTGGYMLSVNEKLSDTDAIGIGRKGTIDKPYILKAPFWTVDTLFYAVPEDNVDLNFMYSIFKKINWKKLDESTGVPSLAKTTINKLKVFIPKEKEQEKIGRLFKYIDTRIFLYQRKIGLLQQLKKAMLQRLFPDTDTYPKLRFGGFSGPWEQRKLRDVIDSEIKGKAKATMLGDKSVYLETGYLNGGIKQRVNSPTNVDEDDVLILWDGSKAGKLYHGFSGALGSTLKAFKPKFSGMFLYQYMSKDQDKIYQQYRTPNIPHVVKNFTDKYLVNLPNLQEQKQIGIFFNQLDTLITLQQRKLDNMNKLKKFMLQQMFI